MKILTITLYKWDAQHPTILCQGEELGFVSIFQRRVVREHVVFRSRTCTSKCSQGEKAAISLDDDLGICYVAVMPSGLAGAVVTDNEYPEPVAFRLINELFQNFQQSFSYEDWENLEKDASLNFPLLGESIKKYQNPVEADKLYKTQKAVEEATEVVHLNLNKLMDRGETLESLMGKSEDLSTASFDFYKRAKKANACCKMG
eukprot:CAMPEP_0115037334 /NCGR_PEP_ID=MMETSP0216-20121206/42729_1 /TAXON_ID=223996 /ORGANISM="Protocruzia adherens, Strain Boccale" /LENGTH=201 /DNA_ID=CAMNT_0002417479 /DNA_START=146 /DNA_END=751 /DNA_ORIENTATION=-